MDIEILVEDETIARIIARKVLQITVSKGFGYNRPSLWLRFVKNYFTAR